MSFEADLRTHLLSNATISGLVGSRIFPNIRREGTDVPAITYSIIWDDPQMNLDGVDSALRNVRVQLDMWAKSFADVISLEGAVLSRMNTAATNFRSVQLGTMLDEYETETRFYRRTREFSVWYRA